MMARTKEERMEILRSMEIVTEEQIHQLDDMGFFTAPASTKHHGGYEGGLFDHSFEVTKCLALFTATTPLFWKREKSPYIIGMFHDLCKCDAYKPAVLGKTVRGGDIVSKHRWEYNNDVVLKGYGEKSVMLLSQFMTLTEEEILCIRYHMGAYVEADWDGFDRAIRKYPNVLFAHTADMMASKIIGV